MSSTSPKTLLQRLGLRPKKSLGQHFLVHPHQARRIVDALELGGDETVVEIGAGLGALTVWLAGPDRRVVALERDPALARYLQEEILADNPGVEVSCQDVLKFDFLELSREIGQPLAVVGNLPYQITSPLLFKLMEEREAISRAVLMMQQEVGARLLAAPGTKDYGILSVLLRYHFAIRRLFSLGPANFFPPPQVDSVVLRLTPAASHLRPGIRDFGPGGEGGLWETPQDPEQCPGGRGSGLGAQPRGATDHPGGAEYRPAAPGGDPVPGGVRGYWQ